MITIVAIGKKHEPWVALGIERYQQRLRPPMNVEWMLLPHSSLQEERARTEESDVILRRLSDDWHVVLLDERGRSLTSPELAGHFEQQFQASRKVAIVIGGAYGVDTRLHERADMIVSLSNLVFPHQLVRLICLEQLYRCQEITRGGQYHHS